MAVDPKIKQKAEDIRKKIFGAEVRESLASGLEGMSEDVESIKDRQGNVESQFQNVIDETTGKDVISAPELIAARNGKSNLKTRLDEEHAQVTAQLQQISPLFDELAGDGILDDSAAIKNIIEKSIQYGSKNIVFPKGTYRMDTIIPIYESDITLDFNGSTIISYATASENVWGEDALFSPRGSLVNGDALAWWRDNYNNVPDNSPTLYTYESYDKWRGTGRITTSDNSHFQVGDTVFLRGLTRNQTEVDTPYDPNKFEPRLDTLAKVTGNDGTYVYVDYYSPFEYTPFTNNNAYKSYALKVIPLDNFKLKNVHFIDNSTFAGNGASPTNPEVRESISFVSPLFCTNVHIENVTGEKHRMNLINIFACRHVSIINTSAKNARIYSGGEGYLMQIRASRDILVDGAFGRKVRHVVDLSFSNNAVIKNVSGFETYVQALDLHGICEHDIKFIKCHGDVAMGNGIQFFPNIVKNVTFEDCNIKITDTTEGEYWRENLTFINSYVEMNHIPDFITSEFINSVFSTSNYYPNRGVNKRDKEIETSLVFTNSELRYRYHASASYTNTYFRGIDKLTFNNVTVMFDDEIVRTNGMAWHLLNVDKTRFNGVAFDDIYINYRYLKAGKPSLFLKNNNVSYKTPLDYFLLINGLTDCDLNVSISGSTVKTFDNGEARFQIIQTNGPEIANSTLKTLISQSFFSGTSNRKIGVRLSDGVKHNIIGNIIENYATDATPVFNDTMNTLF